MGSNASEQSSWLRIAALSIASALVGGLSWVTAMMVFGDIVWNGDGWGVLMGLLVGTPIAAGSGLIWGLWFGRSAEKGTWRALVAVALVCAGLLAMLAL